MVAQVFLQTHSPALSDFAKASTLIIHMNGRNLLMSHAKYLPFKHKYLPNKAF